MKWGCKCANGGNGVTVFPFHLLYPYTYICTLIFLRRLLFYTEEETSRIFRNVGIFLFDYMALYPMRLPSALYSVFVLDVETATKVKRYVRFVYKDRSSFYVKERKTIL
jgi:hypothetical protein